MLYEVITRLVIEKDTPVADILPMQTFGYSVIYLMLLFAFLLADHYLQNLFY